jgi:tetratricopeptide (TPR) repeat protein
MKRAQIFIFTILLLLPCLKISAQEYVDKERFFSYERFFLDQRAVSKIPPNGRTQADLNRFADSYTNGLYALSGGRTKEAIKNFLEAREAWPEYFNTDFLLARSYEEMGDYEKAARFYKSYLNKLRRFHRGEYRISEPIIRAFASSQIEPYEPAQEVITQRLAGYGIRLGRVRPVMTPPVFLLPILLIAALGAIYMAVTRRLVPYLKRVHLMKNPPEGYWVCRKCGAGNTEINKTCEKCGQPNE